MKDFIIKRSEPSRVVRTGVLSILVVVAFLILIARLAYLQLYLGDTFRAMSEENRIRLVKIQAPRGVLMDRHGRIMVDNRASFDVIVAEEFTEDLNATFTKISSLSGIELEEIKDSFEQEKGKNPKFRPVTVARDISRDSMAPLISRTFRIGGVTLEARPIRNYVYGPLAPHLFGYLGEIGGRELESKEYRGYKMGDIIGRSGIEETWDKDLRGSDGGVQMEVDSSGRELNVLGKLEPMCGNNLVLTIDCELQDFVMRIFEEKGYAGSVIAMNPHNFEILAMVSAPGFDPEVFARGITKEEWKELVNHPEHPLENKCISGQYPPGSTYKLLTAAAGLQEGVIDEETSFICPGYFFFGKRSFSCWKAGGHGKVKIHEALVESCDVFFYNVGNIVGIDRLSFYGDTFGLGTPTGISLANEKPGINPSTPWKEDYFGLPWYKGETISCAIGQGYNLVTPLQLLSAFSALANGGTLYRPIVIKEIQSPGGVPIEIFDSIKRWDIAVSPENIEILKRGLYGAVNEMGGTGWRARISDVDVAGKTGTAQVIEGGTSSRYLPYELRDHAWFVCFAPLEEPEIAVVVLVEHGGFGGAVASPIAGEVLKKYFELKGEKPR
jgi:penicillin-binding protein 2